MPVEYLSVTDTAKLLRTQLKKFFPDIKFSVRSDSYAGGASINISWADGPRTKEVDRIVKGFEGKSFDGMNDLATPQESWITPSGQPFLARRDESSGGSIPGVVTDAPHPNARIVHFGSDYVFTSRNVSDFDRRKKEALDHIRQHCSCEGIPPNDRFGNQWVDVLAGAMARDFDLKETIEQTFKRIVLNNRLED